MDNNYKPEVVLWNITNLCNLKCKYCYNNDRSKEESALDQVENYMLCDIISGLKSVGCKEVVLAGGEPTLSARLKDVIMLLKIYNLDVSIITNATNVIGELLPFFKKNEIRVAVSVDGLSKSQNNTRGGDIDLILKNILKYKSFGIEVEILTTVTNRNIYHIKDIIEYCVEIGVKSLTLQQLHAEGRGLDVYSNMIPSIKQLEYLEALIDEYKSMKYDINIECSELLFFVKTPKRLLDNCDANKTYMPARLLSCGVGRRFCVINSDLNVIPCNALYRMSAGNLLFEKFVDIWNSSPVFLELRKIRDKRSNEISGCKECLYNVVCDGGCRADSFNIYNDIYGINPLCPYSDSLINL